MSNHILKATLCLTGIVSLIGLTNLAQAQSPGGIGNTIPNRGSSLSPGQFNNVRPVRQQNFVIDSGSGSQQFFRQGGEQLYLLPDENSEPILKIDDTVKKKKVPNEDMPEQNVDE